MRSLIVSLSSLWLSPKMGVGHDTHAFLHMYTPFEAKKVACWKEQICSTKQTIFLIKMWQNWPSFFDKMNMVLNTKWTLFFWQKIIEKIDIFYSGLTSSKADRVQTCIWKLCLKALFMEIIFYQKGGFKILRWNWQIQDSSLLIFYCDWWYQEKDNTCWLVFLSQYAISGWSQVKSKQPFQRYYTGDSLLPKRWDSKFWHWFDRPRISL